MKLALIDWIIIIVYLGGCMAAGIWMRRFVRGVEDFTVAGREMDVNLGIASLAATELGVITVMYAAQAGYQKGFAGATVGVLMALAMFVVGKTGFIIQPLRAAGVMTIPELFEKRFDKKVRWLAGFVVILGGLLNMGIFLKIGGQFLIYVSGAPEIHLKWVMTVLLGLILLYTALGGMLSVLVTDYLQFLVMGLGIVVISVLVIAQWGWNGLLTELWTCWDGSRAGTGQTLKSHPFNPLHPTSWGWAFVLWQTLFQLAAVTTWQPNISRVLAARDAATARRIYMRSAFYFVGRWALPVLWGVGALVYFSRNGGAPEDSINAMPAYLSQLLPIGVIGIVIAAMLAAEMSTDSGYLLTWATVIYNDLIMPCVKRPLSQRQKLFLTRALVLGIGVFLMFWGLWYELPGDAWSYLAVTGNIYLASVFTLLVAGLYWRRAQSAGAYAALVLGAVGPVAFLVLNLLVAKGQLPTGLKISAELAGASSFGLAFVGMIVGSLLAPNKPSTETVK
jgi:solute:Na+ symporter, SSS family